MRSDYSEALLIQNLRDADCDEKTITAFLAYLNDGRYAVGYPLLRKLRSRLLNIVHEEQKKIDCLDYLVYQMKKAKDRKELTP